MLSSAALSPGFPESEFVFPLDQKPKVAGWCCKPLPFLDWSGPSRLPVGRDGPGDRARAAKLGESGRRRSGQAFFSPGEPLLRREDRKSTRLNSSHVKISYAVFCLKKKKNR